MNLWKEMATGTAGGPYYVMFCSLVSDGR